MSEGLSSGVLSESEWLVRVSPQASSVEGFTFSLTFSSFSQDPCTYYFFLLFWTNYILMLYVIVNLQTISNRLATLLKHPEEWKLRTSHSVSLDSHSVNLISGVYPQLVSVPDPKPTPAQIAFSIVILEAIYAPDEVW